MGAKRKIFISMLSIAFVILAVLATIAVAFALTQQNITTSLSIDYVAIDIDGSVSATYTFGGVETSMLTSDNKPELVFRAADKTNAGSLNMPENKFSFSSVNDNIVLKYTFKNTGDVDYTAIVNFAETDVASENMKLEYSLDGLSYSTTNYGLVVTNAKPREYYLKISIDDKAKNASFTGTFSWVLERYIPTEGEENVVLNTSSYMVNADSETYSATFNPESNLTANSTWYVPSSIGSQQITRIILDNTLPANTKLVVPKGITEVWVGNPDTYEASTCSGLVEVHLSETVTAAGRHVMYGYNGFMGCNNLARISVAPGNPNYKSVNNCVISGSSIVVGTIESVIPDDGSVTSISMCAFDGKNIKSLYVPEQITAIEDICPYAFPANGCVIYCESSRSEASWYEETYEDETYIRVNSSDVFKFDYSPDAYAQDLAAGEALSAANPGFEYVGSTLVGYTGNATSVTIPEGTTSMGAIFSGNKTLTSVTLPSTLTEVGSSAFSGCTGLTNITIPANVETIGGSAFYGCTGLTNITIPANVETIGGAAFYGCTGLTNITIPANVETIGGSAFYGCTGLTNVTFNDNGNLKTIGDSAFYGCTGLTNITIPASVETIARWVFKNCTNLNTFTFEDGSQVTTIGNGFIGNTSITAFEVPKTFNSLTEYTFSDATALLNLSVEEGNEYYYSVDNCIIERSSRVLIKGTPNSIIPTDGSVGIIGRYAFADHTNLTTISIPNTITTIRERAFENCTNLTNLIFAENSSLTTIGDYAFQEITGLTSLKIPASVRKIGKGAFDACNKIKTLTFENNTNLYSIGRNAFRYCYALTDVYITDINAWAQISFGTYGSEIDANPLCYADNLWLNNQIVTSIILDNTVTKIGDCAFAGYTKLTSVTISGTVMSIGIKAFRSCSNLTSVTFENTEGWFVSTSSYATSGTNLSSTDLSNTSTAATYLKTTHYSKYWKCTQ